MFRESQGVETLVVIEVQGCGNLFTIPIAIIQETQKADFLRI